MSIIYRFIKFSYDETPKWTNMETAIEKTRKHTTPPFTNLEELKPYRRNLETIINMANFNGIKVIMTSLPHSTDPNIPLYYGYTTIDQCNAINRELAEKYKNEIMFSDLDSLMTGKANKVYHDLGHIFDEGRQMKADAIGKLILLKSREAETKISILPTDLCRNEQIDYIKRKINCHGELLESIKIKAVNNKVSLEEMIGRDASYLFGMDSLELTKK